MNAQVHLKKYDAHYSFHIKNFSRVIHEVRKIIQFSLTTTLVHHHYKLILRNIYICFAHIYISCVQIYLGNINH